MNQALRNKKFNDLMGRALGFQERGRYDRAERYYKRALDILPGNGDARHLLGLLAHQRGKNEAAVKIIRQAIEANPKDAKYHVNLAIVLANLGRWEEVETAARAGLALDPLNSEALNNLGRGLAGQGKSADARAAYGDALKIGPGNAAAANNLGLLMMQMGLASDALDAFAKAITIDPGLAVAYANKATVLMSLGQLNEAESECRNALALNPNFPKALNSLGVVLSTRGDLIKAEESFQKVMALEPDNAEAISNLGAIRTNQERFSEAMDLFVKAVKADPNFPQAHLNLGVLYAEHGRLDDALASLRKTLDLDPNNIDAYYAIGTSNREVFDDAALEKIKSLAAQPGLSLDRQVKLQFVLAGQAEKSGDFDSAFDHARHGNRVRRETLKADGREFHKSKQDRLVDHIIDICSADFFDQRRDFGSPGEQPVFIIGMPRSGTSLVEKIATAHSQIIGVGERQDIEKLSDQMKKDGHYPGYMATVGRDKVFEAATEYLQRVQSIAAGEARIIDKMPFNFLFLGLIALMFPRARIIHCRRDPKDTGLSCFFQNFVHPFVWPCDLAQIGQYMQSYQRLMAHWRKVLPVDMLEVDYESLVDDQEGGSRRIIDHLGLAWEDGCLDFHRATGMVRTASKWQVREPVYASSIGKWRAYEKHLSPLLDVLED